MILTDDQLVVAGTGHRPLELGGYNIPNPTYIKICQQIEKYLLEVKAKKVISGMALGYDSWLANIAIKLHIPLIAAVPFINQESRWNLADQKRYRNMLDKASEVIIVSEGEYSAEKMMIRNEYMVDNCDVLLAAWNLKPTGGTYNCIQYAKSKGKTIKYIEL